MVISALAFVSGISILFQLSVLPAASYLWLLLLALIVAFALLVLVKRRSMQPATGYFASISPVCRQFVSSPAGIAITFLLAGFVYAWLYTHMLVRQRLPDNLFNRDVLIQGEVVAAPEHDGRRMRFLFRVSQVEAPEIDAQSKTQLESPRRAQLETRDSPAELSATNNAVAGLQSLVRLNWYGDDSPSLRDGDRLQLVVKLRKPSGFLNPGGFDYEKWLFQHRIVATGYVRDSDKALASWQHNHALQRGAGSFSFASARAWLTERVRMAAAEHSQRGVMLALAVGDRSDIDADQWQRFITTGTNHLLAISGLHITLVATAAGLLFRLLWLQSKLLHRIPRQTLVICAASAAAFIYAAMAGFAIPTQRALIMFMVLAVFVLTQRHHKRLTALSVALILVTIWNPLSVLSAGFWMSFCAVAILYLIYSSAPREGFKPKLLALLRGHLLITLGLYPATVLLFQQASLVSPIANFISVPLIGLVVTPAVFICTLVATVSVRFAAILLAPVDWLLNVMSAYLGVIATLPLAIVSTGKVTLPVLLMVIIGVLLAIMPGKAGIRWLLLPLITPLVFARSGSPDAGSYRVTFLDVGQGSAVVVRTATRVLVYDTGAQFSTSFNAADAVIIPYLRSQRIDKLDAVVVSHSDNDHSGGVDELIAEIAVDQLWHSQPLATFINPAPAVDSHWCESGVAWHWDNVHFEFLHPPANFNGSDNNLSCVLRITAASGERTVLTGDIEQEAEQMLLSSIGQVELLMAPHHGSLTSSSADFLHVTRPKYVVYTVGYNNRFGFPRPEVAQRYQAAGALQISTAASGATTFAVGNGAIEMRRYRVDRQKIWHREADDVFAMTATLP